MMRSEEIRKMLKDIDEFLLKQYKKNKEQKKRDWRTYEQQLMNRVKGAIRNLESLINEATKIEIHRSIGRPPDLELKQESHYPPAERTFWGKQQKNNINACFIFSPLRN
jgi:hypothetical protein